MGKSERVEERRKVRKEKEKSGVRGKDWEEESERKRKGKLIVEGKWRGSGIAGGGGVRL